jgi:predicted nucleic acid-binding protein
LTLVEPKDTTRIAELVRLYKDLPLGAVHASVIAIAERLGLPAVATLDRRHFSIVRPRHVAALQLLP